MTSSCPIQGGMGKKLDHHSTGVLEKQILEKQRLQELGTFMTPTLTINQREHEFQMINDETSDNQIRQSFDRCEFNITCSLPSGLSSTDYEMINQKGGRRSLDDSFEQNIFRTLVRGGSKLVDFSLISDEKEPTVVDNLCNDLWSRRSCSFGTRCPKTHMTKGGGPSQ